MIHQTLCLLLIPLMLANQGLLFAHAHHGTDITEPGGHMSRTHFHAGNHDHHTDCSQEDDTDSADDRELFLRSAVDHDADAIYCTATVSLAQGGRKVNAVLTTSYTASHLLQVVNQNENWLLRLGPSSGQPPSVFDTACPLYLRTLSLRI